MLLISMMFILDGQLLTINVATACHTYEHSDFWFWVEFTWDDVEGPESQLTLMAYSYYVMTFGGNWGCLWLILSFVMCCSHLNYFYLMYFRQSFLSTYSYFWIWDMTFFFLLFLNSMRPKNGMCHHSTGTWLLSAKRETSHSGPHCFISFNRKELFEWNVMLFGLCNALAIFQRLMDHVLAGLQLEKFLVISMTSSFWVGTPLKCWTSWVKCSPSCVKLSWSRQSAASSGTKWPTWGALSQQKVSPRTLKRCKRWSSGPHPKMSQRYIGSLACLGITDFL